MSRSWWRRWGGFVYGTAMVVLFILAIVLFSVRDNAAEDRCTDRGGQTWDSGKHCVLGDPTIVSTR